MEIEKKKTNHFSLSKKWKNLFAKAWMMIPMVKYTKVMSTSLIIITANLKDEVKGYPKKRILGETAITDDDYFCYERDLKYQILLASKQKKMFRINVFL
jgi:hypothetical protein